MMWLQGVPICLHIGTQSQHVVLDPLMLSRNRGENMQTSLLSLKPIHGSHVHLLCSLWMRTHCRLFHSDWNYIGIGLLHRNTHIKHRKTHRLPVTLHFLAKGTLSKSRVAPVIGIGDLAPCRGFFLRCVKQYGKVFCYRLLPLLSKVRGAITQNFWRINNFPLCLMEKKKM